MRLAVVIYHTGFECALLPEIFIKKAKNFAFPATGAVIPDVGL